MRWHTAPNRIRIAPRSPAPVPAPESGSIPRAARWRCTRRRSTGRPRAPSRCRGSTRRTGSLCRFRLRLGQAGLHCGWREHQHLHHPRPGARQGLADQHDDHHHDSAGHPADRYDSADHRGSACASDDHAAAADGVEPPGHRGSARGPAGHLHPEDAHQHPAAGAHWC